MTARVRKAAVTPPPITCLAFTAARGWHLATVDVDQVVACELDAYDEPVAPAPVVVPLPAHAHWPWPVSRPFRPADAAGLPMLAAPGAAACAPIAGLFDEPRPDPHTARQMAALCARCPIADDCSYRRTPAMRAAS